MRIQIRFTLFHILVLGCMSSNETCVDDPNSILQFAPEVMNNCSKLITLVNGNCGTDIYPFVATDEYVPPTNPYTVNQLCCNSCLNQNPGLMNPNIVRR